MKSTVGILGKALNRVFARWMPDPFALALLLTVIVMAVGGIRLFANPPNENIVEVLARGWLNGFSSAPLLGFALQMCLVLVTGHALALSPPVQKAAGHLATIQLSAASTAALVAFIACITSIFHWGLGAISGAFLAREIGRHAKKQGRAVHYPLLGGAAYSGLALWHGGLSGSAPLKVAEEGHFTQDIVGIIGIENTLFSSLNLLLVISLSLIIPLIFYLMTPSEEEFIKPDLPELPPSTISNVRLASSFGEWISETPAVGHAVGLCGLLGVFSAGWLGFLHVDLNTMNLIFLFLGIGAQGSLQRYTSAIAEGARGAGAIIIQFPLYFGILGVMREAGIITWIGDGISSIATADTFPLLSFFSAGLVNLFVPSGGGQWAIQGEILLNAGETLGVDPAISILAFSYGDAWTNMLQPFWALPLLGIMNLRAKDIIGYTAALALVIGIVVPFFLWCFL